MIDPNNTGTIRVGELPLEPFNLTDNIPHEIGTDLKRGTVQQLADFISSIIEVAGGVGFRAISVTDGQTLPTTTQQEFILVGKGTYYNVSGGDTIVLTEELNALVSNGSFWFIGVEIPVNVELAGITQFIREGFLNTTPSEDAVFNALQNIDLSSKENTSNKQNSLVVDGTGVKFPTVDAINERYGLVENIRLNSDSPTNLFLGDGSGINNTPISDTQGRQNGFFGVNAGRDNTTGYANLFLGYNAGYQNTTGTRNTFLGYQAGFRGLNTNYNTFIGTDSGYRNAADNNIFIGFHVGFDAANPVNITGDKNIIFGNETANSLTTGYSNNIMGHNAGFGITTGHSNILHGYNSGLGITSGNQNVLIGVETGQALTTGTNNVYLGFRAGFFANNSTFYNTGVGDQSLFNLTTGNLNTGVGGRSGLSLLTGQYNTFIGFDSGNNALQKTDALFSTAIGYNSYNTANNQVVIGGDNVTETIIRGDVPNLSLKGVPTAPTATAGTNTTQIANTAFVNGSFVTLSGASQSISSAKTFTETINANGGVNFGNNYIFTNINTPSTNFSATAFARFGNRLTFINDAKAISFNLDNVSALRTFTIPNLSGTIALKSDVLYTNQTITANKTVTVAEFVNNNELILSVNATSGNITITLPTFTALQGYKVTVKKMDSSANSVLITGVGGINIDGSASVIISGQYSSSTVGANLSQYIIL